MTSDGTQNTQKVPPLPSLVPTGEDGVFHCIDDDFISGSKW